MDRLLLYQISTVGGVSELDYLSSHLKDFVTQYPLSQYRVVEQDILAPDLISYKNYGVEDYWWFILFYNGIIDPFTELVAGDLLFVPNIQDLYTFYKNNKQR